MSWINKELSPRYIQLVGRQMVSASKWYLESCVAENLFPKGQGMVMLCSPIPDRIWRIIVQTIDCLVSQQIRRAIRKSRSWDYCYLKHWDSTSSQPQVSHIMWILHSDHLFLYKYLYLWRNGYCAVNRLHGSSFLTWFVSSLLSKQWPLAIPLVTGNAFYIEKDLLWKVWEITW